MVQQQLEFRFQLARQLALVRLKQDQEMEIEVRGVTMVVARLLEVDAVLLNVSRKLRDEDLEAERAPAFSVSKFGQHQSDVKEAERFAGQVRVGAEVRREKRLEV